MWCLFEMFAAKPPSNFIAPKPTRPTRFAAQDSGRTEQQNGLTFVASPGTQLYFFFFLFGI